MKSLTMDAKLGANRLDRSVQNLLGRPIDRVEAPLKVSGTATYAHEVRPDGPLLYGYLIGARMARGRIDRIDSIAASALPGVAAIVLMPDFASGSGPVGHWGEAVGAVIAESFELAREAAGYVIMHGTPAPGLRADFASAARHPSDPSPKGFFVAKEIKGDVEDAFASAEVAFDATYTTPGQIHAAMEPHASTAWWEDDRLIIHGSYQTLAEVREDLAKSTGVNKEKIRLLSPYIGGGFGSKLSACPEAVLAALGARETGRPVKIAMTRQQLFGMTTRRADTVQRIRLGAERSGRLTLVGHETVSAAYEGDSFFEPAGIATSSMYEAGTIHVAHQIANTDLLPPGAMRAPGEAVGMLALECAIDEMAERLGLDPIEFRRLNEPEIDPVKHRPFSSRALMPCFDEGARRFGWDKRGATGSRREGEWLIGIGAAAAARRNLLVESSARVRLTPEGRAVIETDMTDIGTGSYTILAQVAGEMLGLPADRVDVRLGDTDLPVSGGSGGSWGAASAGSSVQLACETIVEKLADAMGVDPADLTLKDGNAIAGNRSVPLGRLAGEKGIEEIGKIAPGRSYREYRQLGFGAQFAEVAVNAVTGETRVRRMLGVFAAGRILNEKTARSQCIGGMIFGIGAALTEALAVDSRRGLIVNHDLAEYHIPSHADVPPIEVVFLDERDDAANPLRSKGLGELAISGAGAAVMNAVHNACGVRVRDYPATLDRLLDGLPAL